MHKYYYLVNLDNLTIKAEGQKDFLQILLKKFSVLMKEFNLFPKHEELFNQIRQKVSAGNYEQIVGLQIFKT